MPAFQRLRPRLRTSARLREEFPNDAELQELEKLAQEGVERKTEAQRLMAEGQDLCAQQKPADGINLLRQAYELDENNSLARAVLANALIEQAQTLVESDWQEAEKLAKEAFDLNPGHPMAKTMRTLILDQKRETFVGEASRRRASCRLQAIWRRPCRESRKHCRPIRGKCG